MGGGEVSLDSTWKDHLLSLDHLRQGIGLRAYAQRDPLNEYKQEAFGMFESMLSGLREQVTQLLTHIELRVNDQSEQLLNSREPETHETREDPAFSGLEPSPSDETETVETPNNKPDPSIQDDTQKQSRTLKHANFDKNDPSTWNRIGRNAPCPCGSEKKYKQCHGKLS